MQRLLGALLALLISGTAAFADSTPGALGVATSTLVGGKLPFDQGPGTDTALGFTTTQFCLTGGALVICNGAITNAMLAGSIDPAKLTVGTGVATALGINTGSAGAFLKNNGDAITGTYTGAPTFSGNLTFSGIPKLTGLSTGTQVSCLGLDSGNSIVLLTGACGTGGGSGTVTNAANLTDHAPVIGSGGTVGVKTIAALMSGQVMCGATGADPTACTVSGDGTMAAGGAITITKTSGTTFSALATTTPGTGVATLLATFSPANFASALTTTPLTVATLGGSAASHAALIDVAGVATWKVVPDCTDTGGNHINFTQSTDAWSCGTSGGAGGGVTSVTLAPGLAKTAGTRNNGSDAITTTGTIFPQTFIVTKAANYTVNADNGGTSDSGALLIPTAASITFTLPNPGSGSKGNSYQFGSDGTNGYTLTTVGGTATLYGCPGGGGTSLVQPLNVDVIVTDDGTNYKCTAITSPIIPVSLSYAPGVDLTSMPIANIYQGRVIVGIRCTPEVVSGGAATLQPVKAASATLIASGTNLTSNTCNVNTAAATDQSLTVSVTTLAAGDRLGLIGSGASITSANTVAKGLVTVFLR